MKILTIRVDKKPKSCIECPLAQPFRRECGKLKEYKGNGARSAYKIPDHRCQLVESN